MGAFKGRNHMLEILRANGLVLSREYSPEEVANIPGETCPRCNRPNEWVDGAPAEHACCRCHDLGRYRSRDGLTRICACRMAERPSAEEALPKFGVPKVLAHATLNSLREPFRALQFWASVWPRPDTPMVLLVGAPGAGKSYAAAAVCRAVYDTYGARSVFATGSELLSRLRATYAVEGGETDTSVMDLWRSAPLAVLDDLGREKLTVFAAEKLFAVIDQRWKDVSATIVTANQDELMALPHAWQSRIGCGLVIQAGDNAPDRRFP
ncbi:MAG: ATP-binding protein [Dehalococcoidia bacterium]